MRYLLADMPYSMQCADDAATHMTVTDLVSRRPRPQDILAVQGYSVLVKDTTIC